MSTTTASPSALTWNRHPTVRSGACVIADGRNSAVAVSRVGLSLTRQRRSRHTTRSGTPRSHHTVATSCVSIISTSCSNVCSNATRSPPTFRVSQGRSAHRAPKRAWGRSARGAQVLPPLHARIGTPCRVRWAENVPGIPTSDGRHVAAPPRASRPVWGRARPHDAPRRARPGARPTACATAEGARHGPCRAEMPRFRHLGGPPRDRPDRTSGAPPPTRRTPRPPDGGGRVRGRHEDTVAHH